jgi:2-methylaconitate cis-trans-isomerase PrpF
MKMLNPVQVSAAESVYGLNGNSGITGAQTSATATDYFKQNPHDIEIAVGDLAAGITGSTPVVTVSILNADLGSISVAPVYMKNRVTGEEGVTGVTFTAADVLGRNNKLMTIEAQDMSGSHLFAKALGATGPVCVSIN